jgi:arabinose-5-phosphate isomerase
LDDEFGRALDILEAVTGRVIVTGVGKSGHIARKIASTLTSTGCPALFVHPSEANHGDLGAIREGDAVVALSNSGESAELSGIIRYCNRYRIPLIGVTSRRRSRLGTGARQVLTVPENGEACPLGLAPTTSTTMMLALGDCIAVALLERRGFSRNDFRVYHPGGALGEALG